MPLYMLDTNMCIYLMKNQPPEVALRFAQCRVGDVVMSAITYAELEYGVAASSNDVTRSGNAAALAALVEDVLVLAFDGAAAAAYGPIRLATRDSKKDHLDKLIAAHAVSCSAILVTHNTRDFVKYPGVVLEDWIGVDGAGAPH